MPGYAGTAQAAVLHDNQQVYLFRTEKVVVGEASVAYQLARVSRSFYPWGLSFEAVFSASPGTFEIDLMAANNDAAANYISIGTITAATSTVAGSYVGRLDMALNVWPKYIAAYVKTSENASTVLVTLQVTR